MLIYPLTAKVKAGHLMVKTRQITPHTLTFGFMQAPAPRLPRDVRFHNPRLARLGVEAMTLQELRERAGGLLGTVERVDFYLVLLVQAGRSTHMVDFVNHTLQAGTVLLVRPGQVHQWRMTGTLTGHMLLVMAQALSPSIAQPQPDMKLLALDDWPTTSRPNRTLFATALADSRRLHADIADFTEHDIDAAIIRHAIMTLLLRLARELTAHEPETPASRETGIHRLFARELEASFHKRLSVLDYARRLGYSESTLSRACLSAVGHTAKHALDLRIALEAKRLLVHSNETVVQIGHRLGFSEPTNFVKFFKRLVDTTPRDFRSRAATSTRLG